MTLTRDVLARGTGAPPLGAQLADHLRKLIVDRDLRPGAKLPGEHTIAGQVGVSRLVVRDALDMLEAEGLIVKRSGAATRVAEPPMTRSVSMDRYRVAMEALRAGRTPPTAFVEEYGATWDDYSVGPIEFSRETATDADMAYLGVRRGTAVLRRRMVRNLFGEPLMIYRSATRWADTGHTPLADPGNQPWPGGAMAEQWSIGVRPTRVTEERSYRAPNRKERELLHVTAGHVLVTARVLWQGDRRVEAARMIEPANRVVLIGERDL
jgi:GntR family transcriptional regulator